MNAFVQTPSGPEWTLADALERFGPIPLARVRTNPPPGTAVVGDVVRIRDEERWLCELVDGVLVEKVMGAAESMLAVRLALMIGAFLESRPLGTMLGEAGMMEILPGLVRIPDLSFISNERLTKLDSSAAVWVVAPDLAIEVLSRSNTTVEMERKLVDYFASGVREVWYVDPEQRSLQFFTAPTERRTVKEPDTFRESLVLPGLEISLSRLFAKPGA